MSKLVEIDYCNQCRWYIVIDRDRCMHHKAPTRLRADYKIPNNCPLPNASEGAHCADTTKTAKAEGNTYHIPDTGKMVCPHCGASTIVFETTNNIASTDAVCNRCKKSMPPGWSTNHT